MMEVLETLLAYTKANINSFLTAGSQAITSSQIVLGDPNTESKSVIFIVPDGESYEPLSLESDAASATANVFIVGQGAKKEVLFERVLDYASAFKKMLRANPDLSGAVDEARVVNLEYFDGVEGSDAVKAVQLTVNLDYES